VIGRRGFVGGLLALVGLGKAEPAPAEETCSALAVLRDSTAYEPMRLVWANGRVRRVRGGRYPAGFIGGWVAYEVPSLSTEPIAWSIRWSDDRGGDLYQHLCLGRVYEAPCGEELYGKPIVYTYQTKRVVEILTREATATHRVAHIDRVNRIVTFERL
jgi:hypothetical protein